MKNGYLNKTLIYILFSISFGFLSIYLRQDSSWDLRNYHFYNAYAFLTNRLTYDYAPAQLQTYLNPTADLLFYFFVTHFSPKLVGFLMGVIHSLNFLLLYLILYYILQEIKPDFKNVKHNDLCPCHSGEKYKICCSKGDIITKILKNWNIPVLSFICAFIGFYAPISISCMLKLLS